MGGLFGTLAFAIMGGCLVFGGIHTLRNGFEISKGKRVTGSGAAILGILLILLGVGIPIVAAIWMW